MPTENERIEAWKADELAKLGFEWPAISLLISWRVDMHDVWSLMGSHTKRTACTPEQALRILTPLDAPVELAVLTPA